MITAFLSSFSSFREPLLAVIQNETQGLPEKDTISSVHNPDLVEKVQKEAKQTFQNSFFSRFLSKSIIQTFIDRQKRLHFKDLTEAVNEKRRTVTEEMNTHPPEGEGASFPKVEEIVNKIDEIAGKILQATRFKIYTKDELRIILSSPAEDLAKLARDATKFLPKSWPTLYEGAKRFVRIDLNNINSAAATIFSRAIFKSPNSDPSAILDTELNRIKTAIGEHANVLCNAYQYNLTKTTKKDVEDYFTELPNSTKIFVKKSDGTEAQVTTYEEWIQELEKLYEKATFKSKIAEKHLYQPILAAVETNFDLEVMNEIDSWFGGIKKNPTKEPRKIVFEKEKISIQTKKYLYLQLDRVGKFDFPKPVTITTTFDLTGVQREKDIPTISYTIER